MTADVWTFGNPTADAQWARQGDEHPQRNILGAYPYTSYYPKQIGAYVGCDDDDWTQTRGWLQFSVWCGDYCKVGG